MVVAPFRRLAEAKKDPLLRDQQALIEQLVARISDLEALVGKPRKTRIPGPKGLPGAIPAGALARKRPPQPLQRPP
jgi:transposase